MHATAICIVITMYAFVNRLYIRQHRLPFAHCLWKELLQSLADYKNRTNPASTAYHVTLCPPNISKLLAVPTLRLLAYIKLFGTIKTEYSAGVLRIYIPG